MENMVKRQLLFMAGCALGLMLFGCAVRLRPEVTRTELGYTPVFDTDGSSIAYVVRVSERRENFIYLLLPNADSPTWTDQYWGELRQTELASRTTKTLADEISDSARVDGFSTQRNLIALGDVDPHRPLTHYRFDSGERGLASTEPSYMELEIQERKTVFRRESESPEGDEMVRVCWREVAPAGSEGRVLAPDRGAFVDGEKYVGSSKYGDADTRNHRFVYIAREDAMSGMSPDMGGDIWIADIVGLEITSSTRSVYRTFKLTNPRLIVDLKNGWNSK